MPEFLRASLEVLVGIGLLWRSFCAGSVALAVIFGIPQLVIGLTVVSLGTSAPELLSTVRQSGWISCRQQCGGSNIFNVLVVLGCSA